MPFFSSKKKFKLDLTEVRKDKRKMGKTVDPTRAMTEEEPWAVAQSTAKGITAIIHKDIYGNEITDPDRSNPTRHRLERPLETIMSFERAIYSDERELYQKRNSRYDSYQGNPQTQRQSGAYQYGDQSARHSTYDQFVPSKPSAKPATNQQSSNPNSYDNQSAYSQRPNYQQRQSGQDSYYGNNQYPAREVPGTAGTNSTSYASAGAHSGWSGNDPHSTNPSSDASGYVYEQQQQQQYGGMGGRLPIGGEKPLPQINRQQSNGYGQSGYGQQQQPIQQQSSQSYGHYNGNQAFAPSGQRQAYGAGNSSWESQPAAPKLLAKNSSANASAKSGEKRKSWFRRSKS